MSADAAAANVSRVRPEPDGHAGEIEDIVHEVLDGPGVTTRAERTAALEGSGPASMRTYLAKVREQSYRVSDDDFAALRAAGVDLVVAVTGIAGPDGGTADKPVGLVHLAAARTGADTWHERHVFAGDRQAVRAATVTTALRLLAGRIA